MNRLPLPEPIDIHENYVSPQTNRPFKPTKPCHIYHVMSSLSIHYINFLIEQVTTTDTFSIHITHSQQNNNRTDGDNRFISIELIQLERMETNILFISTRELFKTIAHAEVFSVLKTLFAQLFLPKKKFYTWNMDRNELDCFVTALYMSRNSLHGVTIIPLQEPFKYWYNRIYSLTSDEQINMDNNASLWTIDWAMNSVFNENLRRTSHGLDAINSMVNYCLAITKLALLVDLNWNAQQVYQYKKFH